MTVQDNAFHAYTLFSGSKGNGIYVTTGRDSLLIDAGKSARATREALCRVGAQEVPAHIFITHEHSDHIAGVPLLSKTAQIHVTAGCAPYVNCEEGHKTVHPPLYTYAFGEVEVTSFLTSHDSRESVGYLVKTPAHTLGIATDTGVLTDTVLGLLCTCDTVILESNHDEDMLLRGPYPASLKARILSDRGHLSNRACACGVKELAQNGVQRILLAHLSEENNTPELAFRASDSVLTALPVCRTRLAVADSHFPTRLL